METQKTDRQKFGEVLRFHREQRSLTIRRVADMTGNGARTVENFEAGHVVPDGKTWDKYKGIVNKRLGAYSELPQRALKEADTERVMLINSMEKRQVTAQPNGTNGHSKPAPPLAHKPFSGLTDVRLPDPDARTVRPGAAVTYHNPPAAPPVQLAAPKDEAKAQRTREALAKLPTGWRVKANQEQRQAFAFKMFRERPAMRIHGNDSMHDLLVHTFGVGLSESTMKLLRERAREEIAHTEAAGIPPAIPISTRTAEPLKPTPAAVQESINAGRNPSPAAREVLAAAQAQTVNDADLEAAVQLVLGAVPGLRAFTVDVDEHGEAHVNYTVREVKVTERGGSLKVKR